MSPLNKVATRVKSNAHYTCQECGSTEFIQSHHIVPGDDTTLICICGECHSRKHPNIAKKLFFQKCHQPYWTNKSAATLAKELGVCPRTIIRAARKARIPAGPLSALDEVAIKNNIHKIQHRAPQEARYRLLPPFTTQQEQADSFLTAPELADLLHIHINTVRKYIAAKQIQAIKLADHSRWRIPWKSDNNT